MSTQPIWAGIAGIVLDAVGTLIEPLPTVAEVYAEAAARQGVLLDRGEVRTRFHRQFREDDDAEGRGALTTDEANELRRWQRIVSKVLPELADPERAFRELWDHFGRPASWTCYPDVGEALDELRRTGLPIRIASNFDARLHAVVAGLEPIAGLGLRPVISSEVGYRKPHPEFYRSVCGVMGLPPERVLWIGDDLENDVRGPSRAGVRGVWLDRHGRGRGEPVTRVSDLVSLVAGRR